VDNRPPFSPQYHGNTSQMPVWRRQDDLVLCRRAGAFCSSFAFQSGLRWRSLEIVVVVEGDEGDSAGGRDKGESTGWLC
jgi:hypothetical protein